jgi:hypothetical protein
MLAVSVIEWSYDDYQPTDDLALIDHDLIGCISNTGCTAP